MFFHINFIFSHLKILVNKSYKLNHLNMNSFKTVFVVVTIGLVTAVLLGILLDKNISDKKEYQETGANQLTLLRNFDKGRITCTKVINYEINDENDDDYLESELFQ